MPKVDRMLLTDEDAILALLDRHHQATAAKNVEALQGVFIPHGFFAGTDDAEKWTTDQLLYELEKSESGWDLTNCRERHVYAVPGHPDIATFFEVVQPKKYGLWRGSGTVVRESDGWKIAAYTLSFSIPNAVADHPHLHTLLVVLQE